MREWWQQQQQQGNGTALFKLKTKRTNITITNDWPLSFIITNNNKQKKFTRSKRKKEKKKKKKSEWHQNESPFSLVVDNFRHAGYFFIACYIHKEPAAWRVFF